MRPIDADFAWEKVNLLGGGAPWSTKSVLAMLEACPTISPPPNDPLTLEELREMDGEPVWVECLNSEDLSGWTIVDLCFNGIPTKYFYAYFDYYGDDWLAYRRKPEEGMA